MPHIRHSDYYPFGLTFNSFEDTTEIAQNFLYNGKERQTDLELEWYDYGARMYDAALGRWHVVDPMADNYYDLTPYNYAENNPLRFIDILGMNSSDTVKTDDPQPKPEPEPDPEEENEDDKVPEWIIDFVNDQNVSEELGEDLYAIWKFLSIVNSDDEKENEKNQSVEKFKDEDFEPVGPDEPEWQFIVSQLRKMNLNKQAEIDFKKAFGTKDKRKAAAHATTGLVEYVIEKIINPPVVIPSIYIPHNYIKKQPIGNQAQ